MRLSPSRGGHACRLDRGAAGRCRAEPGAGHHRADLQIDAHLDLRDDDFDYNERDPSRFAHSCVMRRACEMGFRTCSVGIREAYARDEYRYAVDHSLPVFEWGSRRGARTIEGDPRRYRHRARLPHGRRRRLRSGGGAGHRHPGAGVVSGLTAPGGRAGCSAPCDVIRADIVEVAPVAGSGLTEYAAAQLCYDLLCYKLLKRDGELAFA